MLARALFETLDLNPFGYWSRGGLLQSTNKLAFSRFSFSFLLDYEEALVELSQYASITDPDMWKTFKALA
jgi:hypothetical protein